MAFGTDPAEARAAADRTTAFYTGTAKPGAGGQPERLTGLAWPRF
jgi:hypothetical protein